MEDAVARQFYNIKTNESLHPFPLQQKSQGSMGHPALLIRSDGQQTHTGPTAGTRFYLNEHDDFAIQHDQIDLAILCTVAPCKRGHPLLAQVVFGQRLTIQS